LSSDKPLHLPESPRKLALAFLAQFPDQLAEPPKFTAAKSRSPISSSTRAHLHLRGVRSQALCPSQNQRARPSASAATFHVAGNVRARRQQHFGFSSFFARAVSLALVRLELLPIPQHFRGISARFSQRRAGAVAPSSRARG